MTKKVMVRLQVEFETRDEATANASINRIPGDLKHSIQEGKMGHVMTGIVVSSVSVVIKEKVIL